LALFLPSIPIYNLHLTRTRFIGLWLVIAYFFISGFTNPDSEERKVIQFSGLVVTGDSSYGVPGVHIYVPSEGRGTTSNEVGFFTMPTLVGDTILITAISFKKRYYIIPEIKGDHITAYINLIQDTIRLPELQVYPWPTEELFKEAFLAMNSTTGEEMLRRGQLNENLLLRMRNTMPMDYRMTYYSYMDDYTYSQTNQYMGVTTGFIDPFAWARFIKDLKRK
jgi:hypothetical protein